MPEGPSIVILKDALQQFRGKKVLAATGNTQKVDLSLFAGQNVTDFKSWGKHFLICFPKCTLRIHFMLFGSYRINEAKATPARLSLKFDDGELNFYACSVQQIDTPLDEIYDWSADVMSPDWDGDKAREKLRKQPDMLVCDALLDQHIFSGVGNIIKNEVLFRTHIHPKTQVGALPTSKLNELISEAVIYSFDFLKWKKEFTLKKHWLAHTRKTCPRDGMPLVKEYLGKTNRRTFYCEFCQELYLA